MSPGRTVPRAIRNVLANWTGYVVGLVVTFLLSPLVVNHLGPSAYGVWTLLVVLTSYLGLLDLGVRSAVTRYVARCESQGDHATTARIVSTALAIFTTTAGFALAASTMLGLAAPSVFHIPAEHRTTAVIVATLAGASTGVALVNGAFGGVLVGLQRFDLVCAADVVAVLVRGALVLGVIAYGGGLVELASAQLLASLVGVLFTAWMGVRSYPGLRLRPAWSRPHLRLIVSYGGSVFVAHLAGSIIDRAGVIVLGAFLPMTAVTVFAIASGLIDYARALAGGIRTTLAPRASALEGRGRQDALRALTLQGARYCTLLVLPIAATLALRGSSFIGLWMGAEYGGPAGAVLAVLAVRLVFLGATGAAASVMLGASRERAVTALLVAEAALNVATMLLLVRPFGSLGVAWGTTVPTVAAALFVWPWLLRKSLGLGVGPYLVASWGLPVAAQLPFIGATWLVEQLWPASSLLTFFGQVAMLMPVALLGLWYVGLTAADRRAWVDVVRAWRSPMDHPAIE
ncbi:MAG TPA: flippase [Methylomirabilota bacterium]|nr:flippase [Methylomirabilota bacterium]